MSLLPQVKLELVGAARRPLLTRRVSVRVVVVIVAALAALLIVAPPSVAQLREADRLGHRAQLVVGRRDRW